MEVLLSITPPNGKTFWTGLAKIATHLLLLQARLISLSAPGRSTETTGITLRYFGILMGNRYQWVLHKLTALRYGVKNTLRVGDVRYIKTQSNIGEVDHGTSEIPARG